MELYCVFGDPGDDEERPVELDSRWIYFEQTSRFLRGSGAGGGIITS